MYLGLNPNHKKQYTNRNNIPIETVNYIIHLPVPWSVPSRYWGGGAGLISAGVRVTPTPLTQGQVCVHRSIFTYSQTLYYLKHLPVPRSVPRRYWGEEAPVLRKAKHRYVSG